MLRRAGLLALILIANACGSDAEPAAAMPGRTMQTDADVAPGPQGGAPGHIDAMPAMPQGGATGGAQAVTGGAAGGTVAGTGGAPMAGSGGTQGGTGGSTGSDAGEQPATDGGAMGGHAGAAADGGTEPLKTDAAPVYGTCEAGSKPVTACAVADAHVAGYVRWKFKDGTRCVLCQRGIGSDPTAPVVGCTVTLPPSNTTAPGGSTREPGLCVASCGECAY